MDDGANPPGAWGRRVGVFETEHVSRFADYLFVIFNNDAQGKSVVNALQLKSMMGGERATAPKELRRKFPMELEQFSPGYTEQQSLFSAA